TQSDDHDARPTPPGAARPQHLSRAQGRRHQTTRGPIARKVEIRRTKPRRSAHRRAVSCERKAETASARWEASEVTADTPSRGACSPKTGQPTSEVYGPA